jgi:hypothetical protein
MERGWVGDEEVVDSEPFLLK